MRQVIEGKINRGFPLRCFLITGHNGWRWTTRFQQGKNHLILARKGGAVLQREDDELIARLLRKNDLSQAEADILFEHVKGIALNVVRRNQRKFMNLPEGEHDDIVSLSMEIVNNSRGSLKNTSNVNGWIYRVCQSAAIEVYRKYRKHHPSITLENDANILNMKPIGELAHKDERGGIVIPIGKRRNTRDGREEEGEPTSGVERIVYPNGFSDREQLLAAFRALRKEKGVMSVEVFKRKLDGYPSKEIAAELNLTPENVDVIYMRARIFLKAYIIAHGGR